MHAVHAPRRRPSSLLAALAATLIGLPLAASAEPAPAPAPPATQAPKPAARVDVNTATEADLLAVPRIGPATAKRILEYRKQVGTIKSIDELLNVKGIGEKSLELLRPYLMVSAPSGKKP